MAVLVDSSVWIDASKPQGLFKSHLSSMIRGEAIICYTDPIQVEVCQGAKTRLEFEKLWDAFSGFQILPIRTFHWEISAWNYFRCRKQGVTVTTIDCLIATLADQYRVPLWSLDHIFSQIQPIIGFEMFQI